MKLGPLQTEALEAVARGKMVAAAARSIGLHENSMKWRLQSARRQLRARTTTEAVAIAARRGLILKDMNMPELFDIYAAAALPEAIRQAHRRQECGDRVDVTEMATNLACEMAAKMVSKRNAALNGQ